MRNEDDHGRKDDGGPMQGRREQYSFIVRLWRTPAGDDRSTAEWFGEVEPVPRGEKRYFFKRLDGVVDVLREILDLAGGGKR